MAVENFRQQTASRVEKPTVRIISWIIHVLRVIKSRSDDGSDVSEPLSRMISQLNAQGGHEETILKTKKRIRS
jgi:hypothetical protein